MIVVFDIGNVLLSWSPRNLFRTVFADEAAMERFLATALAPDWIRRTDVIDDFSAVVEERARAYPEYSDALRLFDRRWMETIAGPIDDNVALLRRLRAAGRPVHALSNFAGEKFAQARRAFPFLDDFDVAVISGEVGAAKPDRRIFEILFERAGRAPEELLLIDDSAANVRAAEALGMPTIHYAPGVDLAAELSARGAAP